MAGSSRAPLPSGHGWRHFLPVAMSAFLLVAGGTPACNAADNAIDGDGASSNDAGYGDDAEGGEPAAPSFPVEDFARRFAETVCDSVGPCCIGEGFAYDAQSCATNAARELQQAIDARYAAAKGAVIYDQAAALDCLHTYSAITQACHSTTDLDLNKLADRIRGLTVGPFEERCDVMFSGTNPIGSPCASSADCVAKSLCRSDDAGLHCAPWIPVPPRGKAGEPCTRTCGPALDLLTPCGLVRPPRPLSPGMPQQQNWCFLEDGLFCDTSWVCHALVEVGESCTPMGCRSADAFCEQGVCTPKRASGSCVEGQFETCIDTSYCDTGSNQCTPRVGDGAMCNALECPIGDVCRQRNSCVPPNCNRRCLPATVARRDLCSGVL